MPSTIAKSLSQISRDKLLELCISWTKSSKCDPYLASSRNILEAVEEDYLHEPIKSCKELSSLYKSLRHDNDLPDLAGWSKRDIIDRILEGDWRRGLSHHQLASIDFAKLEEDDSSLRWTALKTVPLENEHVQPRQSRQLKRQRLAPLGDSRLAHYPETKVGIFVQSLKQHISPVVKAHYHVHRFEPYRVSVVRLQIQQNMPFAPLSANVPCHGRVASEASRCVYIALPDSCPYVYVSISGANTAGRRKGHSKEKGTRIDLTTMKKIILEAIPKALSRPQQRWSLEPSKLTARSLRAMCKLRGNGEVGTTGGAFSRLTQPLARPKSLDPYDNANKVERGTSTASCTESDEGLKTLVQSRFGTMAGPSHVSLDRVNVKIENIFSRSSSKSKKRKRMEDDDTEEVTPISVTLCGSDVFAGLKQLALCHPEYVDTARLSASFSGGSQCSVITL